MGWLRWIGVGLLVLLIYFAGPSRLAEAFGRAQPGWLLFAFLLNVPAIGIKAFRWWTFLRSQRIRLGYGTALASYFSALLVGFLTPGRIGEMVKVVTLKHHAGVSYARGFSSVVADRLFDLWLLMVLGLAGIIRFSIAGEGKWTWLILPIVLFLILPVFLLRADRLRGIGLKLAGMGPLKRHHEKIAGQVDEFTTGLESMTPMHVGCCVVLTLASYSIFFIQCALCAAALGFRVPVMDLVLLMAVTNLVGFLPVAPSNLGTREACLGWFLSRLAQPQPLEVAVAWGLLQFMVLFVGGGLIGFICWQSSPLGLKEVVKELKNRDGHGPGNIT
jgi:uncharacterized protein (TIRG00374 family)